MRLVEGKVKLGKVKYTLVLPSVSRASVSGAGMVVPRGWGLKRVLKLGVYIIYISYCVCVVSESTILFVSQTSRGGP